jgi:hypothetical protein
MLVLGSVLVLLPVLAQTDVVVRAGDTLPTGDHVTSVSVPRIDDGGAWLALVDSDAADLTQDALLLRPGGVLLREGKERVEPAGSEVDEFIDFAITAGGEAALLLRLRVFDVFPTEGLYLGDRLLALRAELVGAPEVPAGTTWDGFDALWPSGERTLFVLGDINNPAIAGPREDAFVRYEFDAASAVTARSVVLTRGQFVPVVGSIVSSVGPFPFGFDTNERGDFIAVVSFVDGRAILANLDTILALEGAPSPVPGRNYRLLALSKVSRNDFGAHAFTAFLDGAPEDDYCLFEDGQLFAREGEVLPFLSAPLGNGTAAPIHLANSGDLFWQARDVNGDGAAFVRNHDVIVQAGRTVIEGFLVIDLAVDDSAFHASPDGRFWAGRVELEGVGDALLTADFGLVVPVPGCAGNGGRLRKKGGDARVGQQLVLEMDDAQALGALPMLALGTRPLGAAGCGLPVPGGELLVDPASVVASLAGPPWNGAPEAFAFDIPASPSLVDLQLFAQGVFLAPPGAARSLLLTNGLRMEIGAP